jgi:hypothetical protein
VTTETLIPEVTITADGVYWHPVGADHADQYVRGDPFPLADTIDEVQHRFAEYRHATTSAAQQFPCA